MNATVPVKPQGCTNLKLRQLMRQVTRHFDAELGKSGLRTTQYSLLSCVFKRGPMRPVDISRLLRIEPSTMTRNLKVLVERGWLTVEAGSDARSRLVSLTEEGRATRMDAQRRWHDAQMAINDILGAERVIALHALLDEASELLAAEEDNTGDSDD
ncbi:MarR family winged helix-turn-helix transcriptional regulator [Variovorax sp. VNK109]|uniref:MarR family winged helix-turn-helix transcriptional regulator n=1 Tax=Variovorax sp. VNK109 TaxID=3400919 RepID=UPI003C01CEFA